MAFPTVVGRQTSADTGNVTAHTVTWPTVTDGILFGDIALIVVGYDGTPSISWPDGTFIEIQDATGSANRLGVAFRRMEGGETGTFTVTTSVSEGGGAVVLIIRGTHWASNPEITAGALGTTNAPDPDSHTASWGAEDTLWVAVGANDGNVSCDTAPASYGNLQNGRWANTNGAGAFTAERNLNAATENPGTFTLSASDGWRAATVAIRPGTLPTFQFDVKRRTSVTTADATSHTVMLPNGSNVSGRLVVAEFGVDGTGTVTWPTGWTELANGANTDVRLSVAYRRIDGTEGFTGTDDSITVTTGAAEQSSHHTYLISSGHHATTAPEAATPATGTDASPNPPSLTPSWGAELGLWLPVAAMRFNANFTAQPVNYSDLLNTGGGGDTSAPMGSARRELNATTEDPGTFEQNAGSHAWVATTLAVRPAAAGGDATATPAVIATTAAVPQMAVSVAAAPAVTATITAAPQPAVSVAAAPTTTPTAVALPQPAISVAAAPAVTQTVVALPQATPDTGGGNATALPAVIATPAALPQPAVAVSAVSAVTATTTALPASTVSVGAAPTVTAATASLPQAITDTGSGNATALPAVIAATTAAPQPALSVGATPATTSTVAILPAAGIGIIEPATTIAAVTAIPLAVPQVGAGPATITATTTVPDSDVSVGAAPGTITVVTTLPLVEFVGDVAADINPVTATVRDTGHTATVEDTGHTATVRDSGHTATAREMH